MNNLPIDTRKRIISLFMQCLLLVKVTTVKDASNFLKVLNESFGKCFENIFELVNACNDELRMLLMEIIFSSDKEGREYIGVRTNLEFSDLNIGLLSESQKYAFLSLGLKKSKDARELRDMVLLIVSKDHPVSLDEICRSEIFKNYKIEDMKKLLFFLEKEKWISITNDGFKEGPRAYTELLYNIN